jgi:hypothetical protein
VVRLGGGDIPKTYALLSKEEMRREDIMTLLHEVKAVIHPDEVYDGHLSHGNQHVWILLDNHILDNLEDYDRELIEQKLAGKPQSSIVLDVSRTSGSQQLAVDFAYRCAQIWPCVVYDFIDKVYSTEELFQLRETGRGFEKQDA